MEELKCMENCCSVPGLTKVPRQYSDRQLVNTPVNKTAVLITVHINQNRELVQILKD